MCIRLNDVTLLQFSFARQEHASNSALLQAANNNNINNIALLSVYRLSLSLLPLYIHYYIIIV
jgi:hypothetical protein